MNGWQRIWLVLTCLGLLGAVVFAWIGANNSMGAWEHVASLKRDLANPACAPLTTEPLLDKIVWRSRKSATATRSTRSIAS